MFDPKPKMRPADFYYAAMAVRELASRENEALRLYEELPAAEPFHRSEKYIRVIRGSNQAGKTLSAAADFARTVTGQNPYGSWPKENGTAFVFGLDGKHLGTTIYDKLFGQGSTFQIFRDPRDKRWKTYHPWEHQDFAELRVDAPPLIPDRYIAEFGWESKKEHVPKYCRLVNGWEIYFFSSLAKPPQGQQIDLGWIDEEVMNEHLLDELAPRTVRRKGRIFWSACPQIASNALYTLHERWEEGDADVDEVHLKITDNPYLSEEWKLKFFNTLDEEAKKVRFDGDYAFSAIKVYPEWNPAVHVAAAEGWQLPADWAVWAAVDPGVKVCAVLFLGLPPPKDGWQEFIAFDELYLERCDAEKFGEAFYQKGKHIVFEGVLIDSHMGRATEAGSGMTVEEQYRRALVKRGVQFRTGKGCYFTWGDDNVKAGINACHDWLRVTPKGSPFKLLKGRCPRFEHEIRRYRYKKTRDVVTDEPEKRNDHLMDDFRYLALRAPAYRKPKRLAVELGGAMKAMDAKRKKRRQQGATDGPRRPRSSACRPCWTSSKRSSNSSSVPPGTPPRPPRSSNGRCPRWATCRPASRHSRRTPPMPRPNQDDTELASDLRLLSLYRMHQRITKRLGDTAPEFEDLPQHMREAWVRLLQEGERVLESAEGTPWYVLAANLQLSMFRFLSDQEPPSWDDQPPAEKLRWEALARHMLNMMVFATDEDGSPQTHEDKMDGWFAVKLTEIGLPEDAATANRELSEQREARAA